MSKTDTINKRSFKKITALDYETWHALMLQRDKLSNYSPATLAFEGEITHKVAQDIYEAMDENTKLDIYLIKKI